MYTFRKLFLLLFGFIILLPVNSQMDNRVADSLITLYQNAPDLKDKELYNLTKKISYYATNAKIRLDFSQKTYDLAEKLDNNEYRGTSLLLLGQAYAAIGDYSKALESLLNSAKYYQLEGMEDRTGLAYSAIGNLYADQKNYSTASEYYKKTIKIQRKNEDTLQYATTLCNLGDMYRQMTEFDSALFYFNESLGQCRLIDYQTGIAYNLGNIALVMGARGKHTEAVEYMDKASRILEQHNDRYPIIFFILYLSDIFHEQGDIDNAILYAQKGLNIAEEEKLQLQIRDANEKLALYYASNNEPAEAYKYLSKYVALQDSINNESTIREMADLRTEFEVAQKQAEVDYLQRIQKFQKIKVIALIVIILLISILAYVLYINFRQKAKHTEILTKQNTKLRLQHKELLELNYTKDRLFSVISHDLRGPMGTITGLAELFKQNIDNKTELIKIADYLKNSSEKLLEMLDSLLIWAMNQQGRLPCIPEKINLKEMVNKLLDFFNPMAQSKQITLEANIKDHIVLWADNNSFTTILRNLINNSLKFTKPGGVVTIEAKADENTGIIKVMDTGIGISDEKLKDLFLFIDNKSTRGTQSEKGLGLGLSLAYEFANINKGSISVESKVGKGTTFTVKIPLYKS
ncbi:MAG: tetratricopeptide repeat-containing sensor histidine kinase [Bacteroidales bacterium]|nr:tetratricopeptide repeat-containing sensor histidine kinase [Bacteroidales bacterium]